MPRAVELSTNEIDFIHSALSQGLRLDGRSFEEFRDLDIQFGSSLGSCHVKLGKTRSGKNPARVSYSIGKN